MIKKTLALLLLVVFCFATSVFASETFDLGGVTYSVDVEYDETKDVPVGDISVTAISSGGAAPASGFSCIDILKYLGYTEANADSTILGKALSDSGELVISVTNAIASSDSGASQAPATKEPAGYVDENGMFVQESLAEPEADTTVEEETPAAPVEEEIKVILHDQLSSDETKVNFPDQKPVIVNDRTLVPARGVFEQMGYEVDWEDATSTAIVKSGNLSIRIPVGQNILLVNDKEIEIDVPAQLINSRTMLPLRAISQALGMTVDWDEETSTVHITY